MNKICREIALLCLLGLCLPGPLFARSAHSPRHSGLEPPGSPKSLDIMPGRGLGQTPDGSKGYIDAYGNPVKYPEREAGAEKTRLRPGAYGQARPQAKVKIPAEPDSGPPVWNFR